MQDKSAATLTPDMKRALDARVASLLQHGLPPLHLRSPMDDVLGVVAGIKPAALVDTEPGTNMMRHFEIDLPLEALTSYLAERKIFFSARQGILPGDRSWMLFTARKPEQLAELMQLHEDKAQVIKHAIATAEAIGLAPQHEMDALKRSGALGYVHKRLGELLGYDDSAIKKFLHDEGCTTIFKPAFDAAVKAARSAHFYPTQSIASSVQKL